MARHRVIPWWLMLLFLAGNLSGLVAAGVTGFRAWLALAGVVACSLSLGSMAEEAWGREAKPWL